MSKLRKERRIEGHRNVLFCFKVSGVLLSSYSTNTSGLIFENSTHFQFTPGGEIATKPSFQIILPLMKDLNKQSYNGEFYSPMFKAVILDLNDNGKWKEYTYNLTDYGIICCSSKF